MKIRREGPLPLPLAVFGQSIAFGGVSTTVLLGMLDTDEDRQDSHASSFIPGSGGDEDGIHLTRSEWVLRAIASTRPLWAKGAGGLGDHAWSFQAGAHPLLLDAIRADNSREIAVSNISTDMDVARLCAAVPRSLLRALSLDNAWELTDNCINDIVRLRGLTHLGLSDCRGLTDASLLTLTNSSLAHTLLDLDLSGLVTLDPSSMSVIARLTELQFLNVSNCGAVSCMTFPAIRGLTKLRRLNISDTPLLDESAIASLAPLQQSLTHLICRECIWVTDKSLADLPKVSRLEMLDCSRCLQPTRRSMGSIAKLALLKELRLDRCGVIFGEDDDEDDDITAQGDAAMQIAKKLTRLVTLDVSGIAQEANGLLTAVLPANSTTLSSVSLAGAEWFSKSACAHFHACTALSSLNLSGCIALEESAFIDLLSSPAALQIERLNLRECLCVSDTSAEYLMGATKLRDLCVASCPNVGDRLLECLHNLRHIEALDLGDTGRFTAPGLNDNLRRFPQLLRLVAPMSLDYMSQGLSRVLPSCSIDFA